MAYYLCRELLEDLHAEFDIPQDEMKAINIKCVDRAHAVLKALEGDELALKGLLAQSIMANNWNDPSDEEYKKLRHLGEMLRE